MSAIPSLILFICTIIAVMIIALFLIAISVHTFQQYLKRLQDRNDTYASKSTLPIITVLIYFELFIIFGVISCATLSVSVDITECNNIASLWFILFHTSRCILYFIFIRRISVVFEDTIFSFDRKHEIIDYILIIIYFTTYVLLPLMVGHIPYINSILFSMTAQYDPQYGCIFEHYPVIVHQISLQDTSSLYHIFMIIYALHLFISPLRQLIKFHPDEQTSGQLYHIVIKYVILHTTMIISALALTLFCIFVPFGFHFSVIDSFLNGMILMLLDPIHNGSYKRICFLPHLFCKKSFCKPAKEPDLSSIPTLTQETVIQPLKAAVEHNEEEEEKVVELQADEKQAPEAKVRDLLKKKMRQRYDPQMKDLMKKKVQQREDPKVKDLMKNKMQQRMRGKKVLRAKVPSRSPTPDRDARALGFDQHELDHDASARSLVVPLKRHHMKSVPLTLYNHPSIKMYVASRRKRKPISMGDNALTEDEFMKRLKSNALRLLSVESEKLW